jgi:hypothetical protein
MFGNRIGGVTTGIWRPTVLVLWLHTTPKESVMNAFEKVLFEALMDVMDKVWTDTESEARAAAEAAQETEAEYH